MSNDKLTKITNEFDMIKIMQDIGTNFFGSDVSEERIGMFGHVTESMAHMFGASIIDSNLRAKEYFTKSAMKMDTLLNEGFLYGIEGEFATPSTMRIYLGIFTDNLLKKHSDGGYAIRKKITDSDSTKDQFYFVLEKDTTISISDYTFMLENDIEIQAIPKNNSGDEYYYSVRALTTGDKDYTSYVNETLDEEKYYTIPDGYTLSDIGGDYLQSAIISIEGRNALIFMTEVKQISKTEEYYSVYKNDDITLTGLEFLYDDDLAYFNVYYKEDTNSEWVYLNKVSSRDTNKYSARTMKYSIDLDNKKLFLTVSNFTPKYNGEFRIDIYTTKGYLGNINYNGDGNDIYVTPKTFEDRHSYAGLFVSCMPLSNAAGGKDILSMSELREKIILTKSILNGILTENDINTYAKLKDELNTYLFIKKKSDISRRYSGFNILRLENKNIIPTSTLTALVNNDYNFKYYGSIVNSEEIDGNNDPLYSTIKAGSVFEHISDEDSNLIGFMNLYNEKYTDSIDIDRDFSVKLMNISDVDDRSELVSDKHRYVLPFTLVRNNFDNLTSTYLSTINDKYIMKIGYNNPNSVTHFFIDHIYVYRNSIGGSDSYQIKLTLFSSGVTSNAFKDDDVNVNDVQDTIMLKGFIYNNDMVDTIIDFKFESYNDSLYTFSAELKIDDMYISKRTNLLNGYDMNNLNHVNRYTFKLRPKLYSMKDAKMTYRVQEYPRYMKALSYDKHYRFEPINKHRLDYFKIPKLYDASQFKITDKLYEFNKTNQPFIRNDVLGSLNYNSLRTFSKIEQKRVLIGYYCDKLTTDSNKTRKHKSDFYVDKPTLFSVTKQTTESGATETVIPNSQKVNKYIYNSAMEKWYVEEVDANDYKNSLYMNPIYNYEYYYISYDGNEVKIDTPVLKLTPGVVKSSGGQGTTSYSTTDKNLISYICSGSSGIEYNAEYLDGATHYKYAFGKNYKFNEINKNISKYVAVIYKSHYTYNNSISYYRINDDNKYDLIDNIDEDNFEENKNDLYINTGTDEAPIYSKVIDLYESITVDYELYNADIDYDSDLICHVKERNNSYDNVYTKGSYVKLVDDITVDDNGNPIGSYYIFNGNSEYVIATIDQLKKYINNKSYDLYTYDENSYTKINDFNPLDFEPNKYYMLSDEKYELYKISDIFDFYENDDSSDELKRKYYYHYKIDSYNYGTIYFKPNSDNELYNDNYYKFTQNEFVKVMSNGYTGNDPIMKMSYNEITPNNFDLIGTFTDYSSKTDEYQYPIHYTSYQYINDISEREKLFNLNSSYIHPYMKKYELLDYEYAVYNDKFDHNLPVFVPIDHVYKKKYWNDINPTYIDINDHNLFTGKYYLKIPIKYIDTNDSEGGGLYKFYDYLTNRKPYDNPLYYTTYILRDVTADKYLVTGSGYSKIPRSDFNNYKLENLYVYTNMSKVENPTYEECSNGMYYTWPRFPFLTINPVTIEEFDSNATNYYKENYELVENPSEDEYNAGLYYIQYYNGIYGEAKNESISIGSDTFTKVPHYYYKKVGNYISLKGSTVFSNSDTSDEYNTYVDTLFKSGVYIKNDDACFEETRCIPMKLVDTYLEYGDTLNTAIKINYDYYTLPVIYIKYDDALKIHGITGDGNHDNYYIPVLFDGSKYNIKVKTENGDKYLNVSVSTIIEWANDHKDGKGNPSYIPLYIMNPHQESHDYLQTDSVYYDSKKTYYAKNVTGSYTQITEKPQSFPKGCYEINYNYVISSKIYDISRTEIYRQYKKGYMPNNLILDSYYITNNSDGIKTAKTNKLLLGTPIGTYIKYSDTKYQKYKYILNGYDGDLDDIYGKFYNEGTYCKIGDKYDDLYSKLNKFAKFEDLFIRDGEYSLNGTYDAYYTLNNGNYVEISKDDEDYENKLYTAAENDALYILVNNTEYVRLPCDKYKSKKTNLKDVDLYYYINNDSGEAYKLDNFYLLDKKDDGNYLVSTSTKTIYSNYVTKPYFYYISNNSGIINLNTIDELYIYDSNKYMQLSEDKVDEYKNLFRYLDNKYERVYEIDTSNTSIYYNINEYNITDDGIRYSKLLNLLTQTNIDISETYEYFKFNLGKMCENITDNYYHYNNSPKDIGHIQSINKVIDNDELYYHKDMNYMYIPKTSSDSNLSINTMSFNLESNKFIEPENGEGLYLRSLKYSIPSDLNNWNMDDRKYEFMNIYINRNDSVELTVCCKIINIKNIVKTLSEDERLFDKLKEICGTDNINLYADISTTDNETEYRNFYEMKVNDNLSLSVLNANGEYTILTNGRYQLKLFDILDNKSTYANNFIFDSPIRNDDIVIIVYDSPAAYTNITVNADNFDELKNSLYVKDDETGKYEKLNPESTYNAKITYYVETVKDTEYTNITVNADNFDELKNSLYVKDDETGKYEKLNPESTYSVKTIYYIEYIEYKNIPIHKFEKSYIYFKDYNKIKYDDEYNSEIEYYVKNDNSYEKIDTEDDFNTNKNNLYTVTDSDTLVITDDYMYDYKLNENNKYYYVDTSTYTRLVDNAGTVTDDDSIIMAAINNHNLYRQLSNGVNDPYAIVSNNEFEYVDSIYENISVNADNFDELKDSLYVMNDGVYKKLDLEYKYNEYIEITVNADNFDELKNSLYVKDDETGEYNILDSESNYDAETTYYIENNTIYYVKNKGTYYTRNDSFNSTDSVYKGTIYSYNENGYYELHSNDDSEKYMKIEDKSMGHTPVFQKYIINSLATYYDYIETATDTYRSDTYIKFAFIPYFILSNLNSLDNKLNISDYITFNDNDDGVYISKLNMDNIRNNVIESDYRPCNLTGSFRLNDYIIESKKYNFNMIMDEESYLTVLDEESIGYPSIIYGANNSIIFINPCVDKDGNDIHFINKFKYEYLIENGTPKIKIFDISATNIPNNDHKTITDNEKSPKIPPQLYYDGYCYTNADTIVTSSNYKSTDKYYSKVFNDLIGNTDGDDYEKLSNQMKFMHITSSPTLIDENTNIYSTVFNIDSNIIDNGNIMYNNIELTDSISNNSNEKYIIPKLYYMVAYQVPNTDNITDKYAIKLEENSIHNFVELSDNKDAVVNVGGNDISAYIDNYKYPESYVDGVQVLYAGNSDTILSGDSEIKTYKAIPSNNIYNVDNRVYFVPDNNDGKYYKYSNTLFAEYQNQPEYLYTEEDGIKCYYRRTSITASDIYIKELDDDGLFAIKDGFTEATEVSDGYDEYVERPQSLIAAIEFNDKIRINLFGLDFGIGVYYLDREKSFVDETDKNIHYTFKSNSGINMKYTSTKIDGNEIITPVVYNNDTIKGNYPIFYNKCVYGYKDNEYIENVKYTLTNIYRTISGIDLYKDISKFVYHITTDESESGDYGDIIAYKNIPLLQLASSLDENCVESVRSTTESMYDILSDLSDKIINNFEIDYKYFKTYGPSRYFTMVKPNNEDDVKQLSKLDIDLEINIYLYAKIDIKDSDITQNVKLALIDFINELSESNEDYTLYISNIQTHIENKFDNYIRSAEIIINNEPEYRIIRYTKPVNDGTISIIDARNIVAEYVPECINLPIENITVKIIR